MAELDLTLYSDEKVLLRTSFFGGFEKKEVLTYIDKLRKQNRTMAQDLATHINEVSTARNQFSEQVSSFEAKITEMEHQLEERGGRIRELTGMVESLRGEVGQQKLRQIEREKDLQQQKDQNRQLVVQLQNYEYKAKRYEDVSAQLGEIILEANQRAADTVAQAQVQAEQIKKNAVTASQKITTEISVMRGELSTVRVQLEELMKTFATRLDEIDRMLLEVVPAGTDDNIAEVAQAAKAEQEAPMSAARTIPCDNTAREKDKVSQQNFFRGAATIRNH
ncbi:MAG TPA: hypothetical protein VN626_08855 [Clostridia bacterium]|nr:hypothetical protein [Clostridia bacterium]